MTSREGAGVGVADRPGDVAPMFANAQQYIIVTGDAVAGHNFYGPYPGHAAASHAMARAGLRGLIVPLAEAVPLSPDNHH